MSSTGSNKRIAKNTLLLYVRMGITMLISLYTSRIVLQVLGVNDYGIYSVVGGITAMFTFINGSLSGATSRFLTYELGTGNMNQLAKTFSAAIVNHFILALIILLLCETIGLWFLAYKLVIPAERMFAAHWLYQFSVFSTILGIMQVPFGALIMAHEKMGIYAYLSIVEVTLKLLLVFILPIIPMDKLIFWSLGGTCISFLYIVFNYIYCLQHFEESHYRFHKDITLYKQMFSYSFWDFLGNMSTLAQGQGLNMLLNIFFGPAVNAARGIAMTVQGAVVQFSSNFVIASKPQIIKLYAEGNIKEMMSLIYASSCLAFYLLYIFALPLCMELDYVLTLWLGEYPENTVQFTIWILLNSLLWSLKSSRITAMHATGKIKLSNLTVGVMLCMTFPISYIFLIGGYPPLSVFIITVIMTFSAEMVACLVLRKYLDFSLGNYLANVYGRSFLVAVLSLLPVYAIHELIPSGFIRLMVVTTTSIICVSSFAFYYGFTSTIRNQIKEVIKSKYMKFKGQ